MGKECDFDGCTKRGRYAGPPRTCDGHQAQKRLGKALTPLQPRRKMVRFKGSPCSFDGCVNTEKQNGLCTGHYSQRVKGRDLTPLQNRPGASLDRFWERVEKQDDGCWLWAGRTINSGYGMASIGGKRGLVHRLSYALTHGHVPDGLSIDHICRNKLCVNPSHLRAVSHTINVRAQGLRTNNSSGVRGVSWDAARSKWAARVNVGGKKRFVGRFDSLEEAAQAVAVARRSFYDQFPG